MNGHHLILGELKDFITDEILQDTHDEQYRQKIARILINEKGYLKTDVEVRREIEISAGQKRAVIKIDLLIFLNNRYCMIIRYAPGSLVTRQRSVIAASRLVVPYQIPIVVVTNGEEAQILDGSTGKLIHEGLNFIPSKQELLEKITKTEFELISEKRIEKEQRIIYAFEIDGACPCDTTICKLKSSH